jgi:osmoprotectant transport system permease protein
MSDAPNRLADGVSWPVWRAPTGPALAAALCLGALICLSATSNSRPSDWAALALAALLAVALLITAAAFAKALAVPNHPAQRQALGAAFWIAFAIACLAMLDAMQRLALGFFSRAVCLLVLLGLFAALIAAGTFDALSLTREFQSHRDLFFAALVRHVALVSAALALSILVCAPLTLVVRRTRGRTAIYAVLGLLQTVPSIALFGLLIAPLTFLAEHVPALKALGVSGLGATPALVALVLYSAFPLVRMSDAAFSAVPPDVADAARGLGFPQRERFFAVDLPLALPVLLSGLRVVTLQAIGLATVAALIGGGGLGTFIFEGIGEYALDLVLVGALPVIALALITDFGFRILLSVVEIPG